MIVKYALITLWHERQRFFAGVLAVAFSAALISLQTGLLLGLFSATSAPVDNTTADVWVGAPNVPSVDLGRPISENHLARMANQPGVEPPETFLFDYAMWIKPNGGKEMCIVIGSRLTEDASGAVRQLTPDLRAKLSEPGSVVLDVQDAPRLGVGVVGEEAQINGFRVRVVGLIVGNKSLTGPYVFCSIDTARRMLPILPDQTTYLLARCRNGYDPDEIVEKVRRHDDLSAFTQADLSLRTRMYWLTKTNAGISTAFTAALALLVGAVVTSQTLFTATLASIREYAVLRALGIPSWRIGMTVLAQSLGVGLAGIALAAPVIYSLAAAADAAGTRILLAGWLLAAVVAITLSMAMMSGMAALRSLFYIEPASLLR